MVIVLSSVKNNRTVRLQLVLLFMVKVAILQLIWFIGQSKEYTLNSRSWTK